MNTMSCPDNPSLHARFLSLLPRIETHARFCFRSIKCACTKADCIAEVVALCWQWFQRLAQKGKDGAKFVFTLASLAARAVRCGRRLCGQEKARDAMSPRARYLHQFKLDRLPHITQRPLDELYGDPHGQSTLDTFEERLHDNRVTPVSDQVCFRLDWPAFFQGLSDRDRRLAKYLSLGHSAKQAAVKFGMSPGRVTQLRQKWLGEWRSFQGEMAN